MLSHISRKHPNQGDILSNPSSVELSAECSTSYVDPEQTAHVGELQASEPEVVESESTGEISQHSDKHSALFLLNLKEKHRLTQTSINFALSQVQQMINHIIQKLQSDVQHVVQQHLLDTNINVPDYLCVLAGA